MVCVVSVDPELIGQQIQGNLEYLGDVVLKLTSFKEHSEKKIGEYDGTIQILKQARLHGLISPPLSPFDLYGLKLQKGKVGIIIEYIQLEPEEERADENLDQKGVSSKKKAKGASSTLCNPTKSHQLDF